MAAASKAPATPKGPSNKGPQYNVTKQLASLIQNQMNQLHNNPSLPVYDYSNLDRSIIDPTKYSTGAANAQYDPQIAALQHQLSQAPGQNSLDLSNIGDWYGQAQNTYNAGAANASKQYDANAGTLASSAAGMLAALGGSSNSANPGIANTATLAQSMLAGNRQADIGLDASMSGLIPLAMAQAKTNQQGSFNKMMSDLQSQMGALKGAKGAFQQSAYQDALGKQFDQLSSVDQAKANAAQTIFGDKMSTRAANSATAGSLMNAIITQAELPAQMQGQALANSATQASINHTKAITKTLSGSIDLTNAGQEQAFEQALSKNFLKSVVDPATGNSNLVLNGNPKQAWAKVQAALSRLTITKGNGAAAAKSLFKQYLPPGWKFDPTDGALLAPGEVGTTYKKNHPPSNAATPTVPQHPVSDNTSNPKPKPKPVHHAAALTQSQRAALVQVYGPENKWPARYRQH